MLECANILAKKQMPWIEKYRPKNISDIISHKEIIQSLKKFIDMESLPHLLFFGPSGSGKTSTIMCCANEIYGKYIDYMVMRLNASNERGIDTVRTKIKGFVSSNSNVLLPKEHRIGFKLIILDEIDSMTVEAQGMLRQTIEKNSRTTRFCLICNEIDRVNIALQSRCTLFRFAPLSTISMKQRLELICTEEHITCEENTLESIVNISNGDMRSAINFLQSISVAYNNKISIEHVYKLSGHCVPAVIDSIFSMLLNLSKGKISLSKTIDKIYNIMTEHNMTIFNLLDVLTKIIISSKFNTKQKIYLINGLALNEIYDSMSINQLSIIANIASEFVLVREISQKVALVS